MGGAKGSRVHAAFALRASGSCDILYREGKKRYPKQTMANNQIQAYIYDPKSDPEVEIEHEQQQQ